VGRPRSDEGLRARPPDARLSAQHRVRESAIFHEAFEQRKSYAGKFMVMWLRRGEGAALRLGVVASKRSFRQAVARSRAKRLLREAYRLNRFRFEGRFDVILLARRAIGTVTRSAVEQDLLSLAKRAGILGPQT